MRIALVLLGVAIALALPFFVYPILLMTILCFVIFASSFNLLLDTSACCVSGRRCSWGCRPISRVIC